MIHSGQFIDIGIENKSDVLAAIADNCQKVSLSIWDIRKPEKVYDAYRIPRNEAIIAFCKGGILGLTISGIVFTDKAIYYSPNQDGYRRLVYTDLCDYIITRQFDEASGSYLSNHGGVFLRNLNGEQEIFGGTLIARNIAGEEIFRILSAIQNELCNKNDAARNKMQNMISDIFKSYKQKLKCGTVKSADNVMIRVLQTMPAYSEKAIVLLAENRYRLFDDELYKKFIDTVSLSNSVTLTKLRNPNEYFSTDYILDLSNINNEISKDYLKKVCANIEKKGIEELLLEENLIYALVLTRLYRFSYAKTIIERTKEKFGNKQIRQAENFLLVYGNKLMRDVYDNIFLKKEINVELIDIYDGLGLTPLHYKLISKSDTLEDVLELKNWSMDFSYLKNLQDVTQVYDYCLLATIKHYPNLDEIIEKTDVKIKELKDNLKKLYEQADSAATAIKSIDICLLDARRQLSRLRENGEFSAISDLKDSIEELENSRRKSDDILAECMNKIPKVNDEIIVGIDNKKHAVLKNLKKLLDNDSPFINLLLQVYENENNEYSLQNILFNQDQSLFKIYDYNSYSFLLPDIFELNLPYYKIKILDDGTISNVEYKSSVTETTIPICTYGESWFSNEAHMNQEILTYEYRQLVKQYHPDVCSEVYANKIFIEITEEYESISNLKCI